MAQEQARSPEEIREEYGLNERSITDRLRENWAGYVFILPTFLAFTALFYYPIARGVSMTFTDTQLGEPGQFVGLANYQWLLTNDLFVYAFGWTIVFVAGTTFLQLALGLLAALLLNEMKDALKDWMGAVIMSPYFSAPLAGGVIWMWFLDNDFGFVSKLFAIVGVDTPSFLATGFWPFVSLIVAQTWHDYAYSAIIYAAALSSIPKEQYEAAAQSGANRLQRFRDVTVPRLLIPTIVILALRTAWNIAEFDQPFALTGGGPGTRTMLLSILTYRVAFVNNNFARAYTIGMAMVLLSMTAALIYVKAIDQEEDLYV
ncbi:carbohydrate ABC transporter permease [Halomicrobium salinisoli]|uniref:carbohydrate ABC transporter permease n=1 Tax=Halomicrobium salinisoli TaxID=2878391 RepID=UPI001CF08448|nr:sugar ABC transporter permease [Halomicrobium salinisoli]